MSTLQQQRKRLALGQSCKDCGHVRVCAVYRAISPLLEKSFTDETRPFNAEDIAVICNAFVSESLISTLTDTP